MKPKTKTNKILIISSILILLGVLGIAKASFAATYYISPLGNDANAGTNAAPFATFTKAFSVMAGGDTLYVMDGVYNQQITGMPSGTLGNYTKIYALNDHKAEIDGQGLFPSATWEALLYINNKSYLEIKGLKVHHSGANNHVLGISGSNHINIKASGFWQPSQDKYHYAVTIEASSDILLEDVWAFGTGRYTAVLSTDATNVTLRRVVTRWDDGAYSGEPISGFAVYKAYNNLLENTITFDHNNHPDGFTAGHHGYYNISWNNLFPDSTNNRYFGTIALNLPNYVPGYSVEISAQPDLDNNSFKDCVAESTYRGMNITSATQSTSIQNCTFIDSYSSASSNGLFNGSSVSGTSVKNTISANNAGFGFQNNSGGITISYSGVFNNSGGNYSGTSCTTSCRTDDPQLKYITRIEDPSPYKGAGENGADIGANIIYRYIDGILTTQPLWPWPYENWIKEDMCDANFLQANGRTGANTPKWCTTTKTLTQYIWEYLGNPIPPEIYGVPADTTPPAAPTGFAVN